MRPRTTLRFGRHRLAPAIQRGTSHTQSLAGFRRLPNPPRQLLGRHDQSFSSLSSGFRGIPSSSEVFFWISNIVSHPSQVLFFILNREDFSFVIHLDRQPRTSRRREAQTGSRARSGSRSERTLDAVEHSRTLMEWWPFLIFHRGGLRIKVINNTRRRWSRAFSRSSSLTRGSSAFAFRPRFLDVIPTLAISSRWRRQLDNCDEYKPSRRRRAATSPSPLPKASASRTIRSLYSALKRRRFACSRTSGSSPPAASRPAGSLVALRAPADPAEVSLSIKILLR